MIQNKCLENNLKSIEYCQIKELKNYDNLKIKLKKYTSDESVLGKVFNIDKDESKSMVLISSLPAILTLGKLTIDGIKMCFPAILLTLSIGQEFSAEANEVIRQLEQSAELASLSFAKTASVLAKTVVLPLTTGVLTIPKSVYELNKKEKRNEIISEMCLIDDELTLISDLKKEKNDISLNFIRNFLSTVDISKNKSTFNKKLLHSFTKYRVAVLKKENKQSRIGEEGKYFLNIIDLLKSANVEGASESFLKDEQVLDLIKTYGSVDLEKTKKFIK